MLKKLFTKDEPPKPVSGKKEIKITVEVIDADGKKHTGTFTSLQQFSIWLSDIDFV